MTARHGVSALLPPDLLTAADYARRASDALPPAITAWLEGGSGDETTLRANREAFSAWQLQPRVLADCRHGSTALRMAGRDFAHPVLLAPVGHQALFHPQGETETARGADATDTGLVTSTLASCRLEEIAAATGAPLWFQLYFQPQPDATLELVRRAEQAGCSALVVTLDTPVQALPLRAQRAGFALPPGVPPNLRDHDAVRPRVLPRGASRVFAGAMQDAPRREHLAWLLENTRLPVIAKGVLHPDDACSLLAAGCAGVVVSNHGGRGLDGAPATLDRLPAIRAATGPGALLLLDGGVRSGADVFRALALGANAVLLGRPQAHALAVGGALGVAHLVQLLRTELESCMALAGCATLADIGPGCLLANRSYAC